MSADESVVAVNKAKLKECLRKVPEAVNNGSYQTARKFKEWAGEAHKAVSSGRSQPHVLTLLINRYEAFK